MFYNDRISAVQRLLSEFTRSPSLRHVRDPNMLSRLAEQIVQALEERSPIWRKWRDARETVIKAACEVWLPAGANW